MSVAFGTRLSEIVAHKSNAFALLLRPQVLKLPLPIQRYDDPFLPFSRAVIDAVRPYAAIVVFDLAAYLALGAAGAVALERSLAYARGGGDLLTVLHGPFASDAYAAATSAVAFAPDGVTVVSADIAPAFAHEHNEGVFIAGWHDDPAYGAIDLEGGRLAVNISSGERKTMMLLGDDFIYATRGEDFGAQLHIRAAAAARPVTPD